MRGEAGGGAIAAMAAGGAVEKVGMIHPRLVPAGASRDKVPVGLLSASIAFALPPRCPGCGAVTEDDHRFCVECWQGLRFLGPPWCARCCLPFAHDRGPGALCDRCHRAPPPHNGVRAAVAYGDVARTVALRLKYGGRTANAETVARLMARLLPVATELIVPVPLHRWRLWSRGFNQAALIATALGRRAGVKVCVDALARTAATPVLRGLGGRERRQAVSGAFRVAAGETVRGKRLVLVDDVHTSGATAEGCTRQLLAAGAAEVTVLCWARVLHGGVDD